MAFEHHAQPRKTFFLLYIALSTLLFRLPYWIISSLVPSLRPRLPWGVSKVLTLRVLQIYVYTVFKTGWPAAPEAEKAAEFAKDNGFVWVEATPDLVVGEVKEFAQSNGVVAERVSGHWYGSRGEYGEFGQKAGKNEKVVYQLHGGGYVMGHAGPKDITNPVIVRGFLELIPGIDRVFCLEYRLSSAAPLKSANPFPAALIDALAGYFYLVATLGFLPENIILSGDSAGANLAVALTRYLATSRLDGLPVPGLLLLLSLAAEWLPTHTGPNSSLARNTSSDFCTPFFDGYPARALVGALPIGNAYTNTWISPGSREADCEPGTFAGFPPTFMSVGEAEVLIDTVETFRSRLERDIGQEKVVYVQTAGGTHDFISFAVYDTERTEALKDIAQWVEHSWS